MSVTVGLNPRSVADAPAGDVVFVRLPLALSAMGDMWKFIVKAYGPDCVCTEEPKGWLKVSKPGEKQGQGSHQNIITPAQGKNAPPQIYG